MKIPTILASFALLLSMESALWADSYEEGVVLMRGGDYAAALERWSADAEADPRSQYSIGYLHQYGLGVDADPSEALKWYEKAGAGGFGDAWYAIGLLYEDTKLGARDLAKAMDYYKKAAQTGPNKDAEYALGRMYLRGRGVKPDPDEAVKWLKMAAEHGSPPGQYVLAGAYETGWGVKANPSEALYWYMMSAKNDAEELKSHDLSFQPDIAIETLKTRLSPGEIKKVEQRVAAALPSAVQPAKAEPPPVPPRTPAEPPLSAAAPTDSPATISEGEGGESDGTPKAEAAEAAKAGRPFPITLP
ncbi:hypothetical protein FACS1894205_0470 [Alphaproteobacteria bacterium]|nr:hypothetical protein FACS1894205_0470 [Alphaproteobacteria bacterium]